MNEIRWGIIGCGAISGKFAAALKSLENARLAAAGARDAERAADFAAKHGFEKSYGSYQELAADPDIDVVYIGSIHPAHMKNTLLCIENGKSVLCEKPFAMNAHQAETMIDSARAAEVFLMEAMWTRFLPAVKQLRKFLAEGLIGDVSCFGADFGFRAERNLEGRILNPQLGGGSLLDVGIYPVSFASMVFGCQPTQIESMVEIGPTGVDEKAVFIMDYGNNRLANITCSINTNTSSEAVIAGTKGYIKLHRKFWSLEKMTIHLDNQKSRTLDYPFETGLNGFSYEAMAVMEDIADGKKQNGIMPLSETLQIMKTLDKIRDKWRLKYPCQ